MGWHEHDEDVFHGCEKFFRLSYAANLISSWIPSLRDYRVKAKLEAGARVADVGCGKGASTVLMAKAFPKSQFFGFDYHDKSIEGARATALRGPRGSPQLWCREGQSISWQGLQLGYRVRLFARHGRSGQAAATHVRNSLNKDGTWMIVEPFANDELKDNLNPVGRVMLLFSDFVVHSLFILRRK